MFNISQKPADALAAIDEHGHTLTYGELDSFCTQYSQIAEPRSLAFLLCKNCIAAVMHYAACLENGVVPVMLSADMDEGLLRQLVSVYNPQYLIEPEARFTLHGITVLSKDGYRVIARHNDPCMLDERLALLLTTSGSTGTPKLVRLSYSNLQSNASAIIDYLGITEKERAVTNLPMNYSYGMSIINTHILAGATLLITNASLMQKEFWGFLKEQKATSLAGVPYTYEMLKKLRFMRMDLPHLKTLTQAGGKLPEALHEEFARWAAGQGKAFVVMYGQTEASPRMAYLPACRSLDKIGYAGIPVPGGSFSLIGPEGKPIVEPNIEGELVYAGPNVSFGYASEPVDLALGDENKGVLHTGDIAVKDSEGFYRIVGRMKRFLKIYGNRVNLDECERIIKSKFDIECACSGKDDLLCIYLTDQSVAKEAERFLSEKLGLYFKSIASMVIPEIPKSEAGKIQYKELPPC